MLNDQMKLSKILYQQNMISILFLFTTSTELNGTNNQTNNSIVRSSSLFTTSNGILGGDEGVSGGSTHASSGVEKLLKKAFSNIDNAPVSSSYLVHVHYTDSTAVENRPFSKPSIIPQRKSSSILARAK